MKNQNHFNHVNPKQLPFGCIMGLEIRLVCGLFILQLSSCGKLNFIDSLCGALGALMLTVIGKVGYDKFLHFRDIPMLIRG